MTGARFWLHILRSDLFEYAFGRPKWRPSVLQSMKYAIFRLPMEAFAKGRASNLEQPRLPKFMRADRNVDRTKERKGHMSLSEYTDEALENIHRRMIAEAEAESQQRTEEQIEDEADWDWIMVMRHFDLQDDSEHHSDSCIDPACVGEGGKVVPFRRLEEKQELFRIAR